MIDIWPTGRYGLPKAESGCPSDFEGALWKEGWIQQDMQDNDNKSTFSSSSFHMDAVLTDDDNVKRKFCMQIRYTSGKPLWPKGMT